MIKEMKIETNRLIIRPYYKDDLCECFQLMQDQELFKYYKRAILHLKMVLKGRREALAGTGVSPV